MTHTLSLHIVLIGLFLYDSGDHHISKRGRTHTFMVPWFVRRIFQFTLPLSYLFLVSPCPFRIPVILTTNHAIILLTLTCSSSTTGIMPHPLPLVQPFLQPSKRRMYKLQSDNSLSLSLSRKHVSKQKFGVVYYLTKGTCLP